MIDKALDFWAHTLRPILIKQYRPFWNLARDGRDALSEHEMSLYWDGMRLIDHYMTDFEKMLEKNSSEFVAGD